MNTLKDCVKVYERASALRQAEREIEEVKQRKAVEEDTQKAFTDLGLEPIRVNWQNAYFDLEGVEIHLVVTHWKREKAFYRVLEKCPNCENNLLTDEHLLSLENIGEIVSNPKKQYHDCYFVKPETEETMIYKPTARENLMDTLDAYIRSVISIEYQ
jgi:hypothetical protein